jgi:hypothetical protein
MFITLPAGITLKTASESGEKIITRSIQKRKEGGVKTPSGLLLTST